MLGEACDPNPPVGHPRTDLREGYRLLVRHGSRHIRIQDDREDPGVLISETELLGALGVEHFTHLATVGHVMSPRAHTVPATAGWSRRSARCASTTSAAWWPNRAGSRWGYSPSTT
jgi:CBS domain-containing protein